MVICPRCHSSEFVELATGYTHYMCMSEFCFAKTGTRCQFTREVDEKIKFPHNVIFGDRLYDEFFRKPYLRLPSKTG